MTRTHAKFALVSGNDWNISIRTSMNFNANPRFEQFDLDDNPQIFEFFYGLVDSLFTLVPMGLDVPGPTINKAFTNAFRAEEEPWHVASQKEKTCICGHPHGADHCTVIVRGIQCWCGRLRKGHTIRI
jgi:hypothetical protein